MITTDVAQPGKWHSPLSRRQRILQSSLSRVRPAAAASALKRILGVGRVVCHTPDGAFWVDPYSHFGEALTNRGFYERAMCQTVRDYLRPGQVFADVGANEGFFSVIAGRQVGPSGRVISVEPQSRLQGVIQKNLQLNGVADSLLIHAAVAAERGTAPIHLSPDLNTGSSGFSPATRYKVPSESVETILLSDIFDQAKLETVDLMKIDIEGYEDDAVLGSPDLFRKGRVRVLALELHRALLRERNRDPEELIQFLVECGYTCKSRDGCDHRSQFFFERTD